ncbi:GNAT family N-acetyltransferase [Anabaena cylindrica UHCC 0172]|uniref:GNAT family N-acetyltransferase n=1 Tax=Anabaena cylindrica TaxID=1165 RepID=UPI002B20F2EF|nr:GNAT family N-acetyltransferase [Anabaena cylindrica]MEA5551411.1 GNAT family N-acetyltransferase [Anabaena cylindrica UHCC 0172]
MNLLLPGYHIRRGSTVDRAILVKFMQRTYQEMFSDQDFSHLALTVEQYFSTETPLWWVYEDVGAQERQEGKVQDAGGVEEKYQSPITNHQLPITNHQLPIACLWVGNAIDQIKGDRHTHIFLLYVVPEHRRRGIGKALMNHVENWAKQRGDRQIALQVFQSNTPALQLYHHQGYQTQSLWMVKPLH